MLKGPLRYMLLISNTIFIGNQSDVQSIHQMRMVANTGMMLIYKYLVNKSINSFFFEQIRHHLQ